MKAKKIAGIFAAILLFGVSISVEGIEKKEQKEEGEFVEKIENKIEENNLIVKEEPQNQNEITNEEKSNALAYTLVATGGVVVGWISTCIVKKCLEDNLLKPYEKEAIYIKTIFDMKKEDLENKTVELESQIDRLNYPKAFTGEAAWVGEDKIGKELALCQKVLDAQKNDNVKNVLEEILNDLKGSHIDESYIIKDLIKKFDAVETEVLQKEFLTVVASAFDDKINVSASAMIELKKDNSNSADAKK